MYIWEAARKRVGAPWQEGGIGNPGYSCYSMVVSSCKEAGFDLDPEGQFSRKTHLRHLYEAMCERSTLVPKKAFTPPIGPTRYFYDDSILRPSDIVVYDRPRDDVHLGIITPGDRLTPLKVVYTPFQKTVIELPIRLSEYKFRWVFRLPNQE